MTLRQRAVNDAQKAKRRQEILAVAARMFRESSYNEISVAGVARQAGIAKGTVYLYFKTKEALFLALQTQAFEQWFDRVDERLAALPAKGEVDQVESVARLISETLVEQPMLIRLVAILHTVLEQNIDAETALAFKMMLRRRVSQTGDRLEACLPWLPAGQGQALLLKIHALVIGLQHLSEPAAVIQQVLTTNPPLQIFQVEFETTFAATLTTLLRGLRSEY